MDVTHLKCWRHIVKKTGTNEKASISTSITGHFDGMLINDDDTIQNELTTYTNTIFIVTRSRNISTDTLSATFKEKWRNATAVCIRLCLSEDSQTNSSLHRNRNMNRHDMVTNFSFLYKQVFFSLLKKKKCIIYSITAFKLRDQRRLSTLNFHNCSARSVSENTHR